MIPWTEEPNGLQSLQLQRVRQNCATNTFTFHFHSIVYSYFIHSRNDCTVQQTRKISVILCPYLHIGWKSSGRKGSLSSTSSQHLSEAAFLSVKTPLGCPYLPPSFNQVLLSIDFLASQVLRLNPHTSNSQSRDTSKFVLPL